VVSVVLIDVGFGVLNRAGNNLQRHVSVFLSAHAQYFQSQFDTRGEQTNKHADLSDRFLVSSRPLLRMRIANCNRVILRNCMSRRFHGYCFYHEALHQLFIAPLAIVDERFVAHPTNEVAFRHGGPAQTRSPISADFFEPREVFPTPQPQSHGILLARRRRSEVTEI
jgi:hypothetical protein